MRRFLCCTLPMMFLVNPTSLIAQSAQGGGHYAYHTVSETATEMADGRTEIKTQSVQATQASDPDHSMNGQRADCFGQFPISADGSLDSGSGTCFSKDADQDGFSFWWTADEEGTEACPGLCGSYSYYGGYGKYEGLTGSGSWRRTALIGDSGMGVWTGSYSTP